MMNPELDSAASEPGVDELTVLDLFKSVTKDWRSFFNFLSSLISEERRLAVERAAAEEAHLAAAAAAEPLALREAEVPRAHPLASTTFPWRSGMGMLLALFAQLMLEPPGRRAELAVACYIF